MEYKDIIEALEYCSEHGMFDACPYQHKQYDCSDYLKTDALKLIKNQQAENRKLKFQVKRLKNYDEERDIRLHARLVETAKTEAYNKFADLMLELYDGDIANEMNCPVRIIRHNIKDIRDELIKELKEN